MFPHSASVTGRPWSPWEGALALFSGLGESELIYFGGGGGASVFSPGYFPSWSTALLGVVFGDELSWSTISYPLHSQCTAFLSSAAPVRLLISLYCSFRNTFPESPT